MGSNTLIVRRTLSPNGKVPALSSVGAFLYFDFGIYGKSIARIVKVLGDYVTYDFPVDFDLNNIKEHLYEAKEKSLSIQSIQSLQGRNVL